LTDLHVFTVSQYEEMVSGMSSAYISAWTAGRILFFLFNIWEFIHYMSVPGEYEHFSSKNMGLSEHDGEFI
jgi:hypothetical protein